MKKILKKHHIFAISLLFALSGITAVTYSFYADNDSLTNQMKLGIQSGEILEEFDGKEKKVFVENTGTTPLLVRANAKMVCTNDGIVLDASKIAIADYNLTDWMDGDDGWYYYTKVLPNCKVFAKAWKKSRIYPGFHSSRQPSLTCAVYFSTRSIARFMLSTERRAISESTVTHCSSAKDGVARKRSSRSGCSSSTGFVFLLVFSRIVFSASLPRSL